MDKEEFDFAEFLDELGQNLRKRADDHDNGLDPGDLAHELTVFTSHLCYAIADVIELTQVRSMKEEE